MNRLLSLLLVFGLVMPFASARNVSVLHIRASGSMSQATWVLEYPSFFSSGNRIVNVTYAVYSVVGLKTWQVEVLYNPSEAEYVNATVPTDNIFSGHSTFGLLINNATLGVVYLGYIILNPANNTEAVSGSGTLVVVTFNLKAPTRILFGTSHAGTFLLDADVNRILYSYHPDEAV